MTSLNCTSMIILYSGTVTLKRARYVVQLNRLVDYIVNVPTWIFPVHEFIHSDNNYGKESLYFLVLFLRNAPTDMPHKAYIQGWVLIDWFKLIMSHTAVDRAFCVTTLTYSINSTVWVTSPVCVIVLSTIISLCRYKPSLVTMTPPLVTTLPTTNKRREWAHSPIEAAEWMYRNSTTGYSVDWVWMTLRRTLRHNISMMLYIDEPPESTAKSMEVRAAAELFSRWTFAVRQRI